MSNKKETFGRTVGFVVAVCLVCAALVSFSAVQLKPLQTANKLLDKQTKILEAAGLLEGAGKDIVGTYNKRVEAFLIDLDSGEILKDATQEQVNAFDERRDARDVTKSKKPQNDIAGINRRANNSVVYVVRDSSNNVETVILPFIGSGLWDLMTGFVGLEPDLNTVKNVIYVDHKETPGLGAEVLNPKWKALWPGKKMFDEQNNVAIKIVKGGATKGDIHGVDALSGATLTSVGVEHTLHFWLGNEGYGPFINKFRNGGLN